MLGFECASVAGDRVENPGRNIPRATLIGTLIAGLIYLLACSAVTLLLPSAWSPASNAPFAISSPTMIGSRRSGSIVAVVRAIAALGALNGFVLLQAEIAAGAGAGRIASRAWFAKINRSRFRCAHRSCRSLRRDRSARARQLFERARQPVPVHGAGDDLGDPHPLSGRALASCGWHADGGSPTRGGFTARRRGRPSLYSLWALYGAGIEALACGPRAARDRHPGLYLLMRRAAAPARRRRRLQPCLRNEPPELPRRSSCRQTSLLPSGPGV